MSAREDSTREPFSLGELLRAGAAWVARNREMILAFGTWSDVEQACDAACLYAPADGEAWERIAEARQQSQPAGAIEALVLDLYGPDGVGHDTLLAELASAPLLAHVQRPVDELVSSLDDSRHYVTICGALPLVEGTLARAFGKWQKRPDQYPLQERLDEADGLDPDDEAEILLNFSAIHMLDTALPDLWKNGPQRVGTVSVALNRHLALHGTAHGWDTRENAVRAMLLLAAAARVAGPLLEPRGKQR